MAVANNHHDASANALLCNGNKKNNDENISQRLRMEEWLNKNPQFVEDYFMRNATPQMVDRWLAKRSRRLKLAAVSMEGSGESDSPTASLSIDEGDDVESITSSISSIGIDLTGSNVDTVRQKLSQCKQQRLFYSQDSVPAQDDSVLGSVSPKRYYLRKSRSFTTTDANFSSTVRAELLQSVLKSKVTLPRTDHDHDAEWKSHLNSKNQQEIFVELIRDIANELDLDRLSNKISLNVCMLAKAERCMLYLIEGSETAKELKYQCLYVDRQQNDTSNQQQPQINRRWGQGIVGWVGRYGETVKIDDATKDPRCQSEANYLSDCKIDNLLCMPIKDSQGNVLGVVEAINKKKYDNDVILRDDDLKVLETYLIFCGIHLTNAKLWKVIKKESERNKTLLELTHALFEEQTSPDKFINKIMERSQMLLKSQKCRVLLVDDITAEEPTFNKIFELRGDNRKNRVLYSSDEVRLGSGGMKDQIAAYVVTTGEHLNISDFAQNDLFDDNSFYSKPEFEIYSLLAMPIRDNNLRIIGVAELINKMGGQYFDKDDKTTFEAFVIFCGLGIVNTMMYDSVCEAKAQQTVALEVCSYHATAPKDEVIKFQEYNVPTATNYNLRHHKFDDFSLDADGMILASIRMFKEFGFIQKFKINYTTLCSWLLTVRKNYRNVKYHNWRHAFNVAQVMFSVIKNTQFSKVFSDVECLALIVGCLCHDLDHRGTNNAYQIKSGSSLARLYSTSTMENHHFSHAVMIFNAPGHNILKNFATDEYSKFVELMKQAILATDLALYFKKRDKFFQLIESNELDFEDHRHINLTRSMLMTAADVGAITKPWEVEKQVAELISAEFFEQGDLERQELKIEPQKLMDRKRKDELAAMQVEFIDAICMPLYAHLAKLDPKLQPLLDGVVTNRINWIKEDEQMRKRKLSVND